MRDARGLTFVAGLLAVASGVATLLAGVLHPSPTEAGSMRDAVLEMTASASWDVAHWASLIGFPLLVVTLALLLETPRLEQHNTLRALVRVSMAGALFMAVEATVHLVSVSERQQLVAGDPTPLLEVSRRMQTIGWPWFGLGMAGLALVGMQGRVLCGRWAGIVGVLGGLAFAAGGSLTEGLAVIQAGILFPVGLLLSLWLMWVGIRLVRSTVAGPLVRRTAPASAEPSHG